MSNNTPESNNPPSPDEQQSPKVCQKCGAPLDAMNLENVCPACLMQVGFESDANEKNFETAANPIGTDDPSLNEGDTPEAIQKLFPGLEILELIGRGGMGVVYKARQTHLGRLVALKLLRAKCSGDPSLAERFTREARALAKLSHPNIVGVHDFGQADDRPYLIMEYVDGVNLRSMLESKSLKPVEAMAMVPAICEALQFAHDEGVVHRDIKPENILVDRRGRVRIADFGLARLMSRSKEEWTLTGTRQVMGTPHYMAPEQIEHPQEVDHRADIYSLGVVIYEMLTGELPIGRFELPSNKINVDVRFDDIVLRTLEKEPLRRYQHVTEVQTAVEKIATDARHSPSTQPSPLSSVPIDAFVKIAALGVIAAAIVDTGIAIAMLSDTFSRRLDPELLLGSAYHAILAGLLGFGGLQMFNHGPHVWRWTPLLAIFPIHFGALAAWPFAILYLILFLIGFRLKSTEQLQEKLALEFRSKSQSLNDGLFIALTALLNGWKRFSSWIASHWHILWRRTLRGMLLIGLWIAFCAVTSAGVFWFFGRFHFPTTLSVSDLSARSIVLSTTEEIRMRIDSDSTRSRSGFVIQPEDLKRSEIQLSLYQAKDRPDLMKNFNRNLPHKVYLSEAFVAHFTPSHEIEFEVLYPNHINGRDSDVINVVVEPNLFKSKPGEGVATNRINASIGNAGLWQDAKRNTPNEITNRQYRPSLSNAKPIEKWLATAGMSNEEASKTAAGIYDLLIELANTGGIVQDELRDAKLKPLAEMLDKEIFSTQSSGRISVSLSPQPWAIEAWISTTIGLAVLGLVGFFAFKLSRTSGSATTPNPLS